MYVQVDQKANSHSREQQQQHGRRRGMRSIEHDDDEMMVCSRLEIFVRIMTPFARLVSFNGLCSSRENSDTHHHHHRHHHSNREQRTSIATDRLLFIIVFTLTNVFSSMEAHVTTTERSCLFSCLSRTICIDTHAVFNYAPLAIDACTSPITVWPGSPSRWTDRHTQRDSRDMSN